MRWNKVYFLCYLLLIIWSCTNEPDGPINPPDPYYIYGGKINDIGEIYVDTVSVAESLNVVSITLALSGGNADKVTTWTAFDPDDPATDTDWVDPNDVYGPWGEDNGYIGSIDLDDYFPVPLPTFHNSKSDAYNGMFDGENFYTDENGRVRLFMRVYPDNSTYQGYHPGDNFSIRCVIGDTGYYSDTITAWKKMRMEYDYMEGCTLSTLGFTTIERAFGSQNVIYGGYDPSDEDYYNHHPYLEFKDDSTHLFISDQNLYPSYFFDVNAMYNFYLDYRDDPDHYPFYVAGACSLLSDPNSLGVTLFFVDPSNGDRTPFMTSVFVPKLINTYSGSLSSHNLKIMIGLVTVHELGHFAAKLSEAYLEPGDHVDPNHCFMNAGGVMVQNLNRGENMFFCPACIYRFRGNMYIEGPQAFSKRGEK